MTKGHGYRLVLASASPRRRQLLRQAGIPFTSRPAHVNEARRAGEPPAEYAQRLARDKARAVQRQFPNALVLGADTIVVVKRQILGKPRDAADAARMLRLLSGRSHQVITGVALLGVTGNKKTTKPTTLEDVRCVTTEVFFNRLREEQIRSYVASGEPMDKAGAYAIQGRASRWIPKISGDYCNVVGLPVSLVAQMLEQAVSRAISFRPR